MGASSPPGRGPAAAALVAARIVYAFNWYNVGAVLPLIGRSLGAGTAALGIVLGAFLVGVSIFQVPAGLASARYGPRRVSLAGIGLFGSAGVASAFAPTWESLAALRFLGGVGAAFFFSPALSLIASYYPGSRRGPLIGLFNGGFSLGGAASLVLGAYLGVVQGWPAALGYGGAALVAATLVAWLVLPGEARPTSEASRPTLRATASGVLRSRSIWALSLATTGFWGAVYIVAQYFVDYAETDHPAWGIGTAALLTAGVIVMSFPGGPIGGWIAERGRDRRGLLGAFALVAGLLIFLIPVAGLWALWPIFVLLGFLDGMVFAILYLIPTYLEETRREGLALGVAVVNSIQVLLGSGIAIAFGAIAQSNGYPTAWWFAGLLSVGLVPLLALVRPNRAEPAPVEVPAPVAASGP